MGTSREEVEELVNEMFSGWVYDKVPKKLLKQIEKYVDFQRFEEHFTSEILMTCVEEKGVENGCDEILIFETAGF